MAAGSLALERTVRGHGADGHRGVGDAAPDEECGGVRPGEGKARDDETRERGGNGVDMAPGVWDVGAPTARAPEGGVRVCDVARPKPMDWSLRDGDACCSPAGPCPWCYLNANGTRCTAYMQTSTIHVPVATVYVLYRYQSRDGEVGRRRGGTGQAGTTTKLPMSEGGPAVWGCMG